LDSKIRLLWLKKLNISPYKANAGLNIIRKY
jgi:hypothetical protein